MLILENFLVMFVFMLLGVFIGVPLGIIYITPMLEKMIYMSLVIICVSLFIFGIKNKQKKIGKILIIFSLWGWFSLSAMGFVLLGA